MHASLTISASATSSVCVPSTIAIMSVVRMPTPLFIFVLLATVTAPAWEHIRARALSGYLRSTKQLWIHTELMPKHESSIRHVEFSMERAVPSESTQSSPSSLTSSQVAWCWDNTPFYVAANSADHICHMLPICNHACSKANWLPLDAGSRRWKYSLAAESCWGWWSLKESCDDFESHNSPD